MKCVVTTSYFCTKWRLFINFFGLYTHSFFIMIWQPHNVLYTIWILLLFSIHPRHVLMLSRDIIPEVKLVHFALFWCIGPTWSIGSRLFLQALPWPLTKFWPLLLLPPLSFSGISFSVVLFTLSLRIPIQTCSSVADESFLSVCPTHFHSCTLLIWVESACFLLMSLM